jgi:hypothetical protein
MATTTPNYGWTVPTSTDLVKDGATAIETLGDAIDASMNTALGTKKAGMVLLNTTSFSAVASQSINTVFSATYDYYKIIFDLTNSVDDVSLSFRLRASATDNSNANYNGGRNVVNTAGGGGFSSSLNATSFLLAQVGTNKSFTQMEFSAVSEPRWTTMSYQGFTNGYQGGAGGLEATYTADGFTIFSGSGNITGTVSVYGYNK